MFVVNFRFVIVIITYDLFISLVTISISTFSGLKRPFRNTLLGAPRIETIKPDFRLVYCTTACTNISVQQLLISLIDHCSPSFVKRLSRHRIHFRWSWSNRFCFELVKFSVIFDKKIVYIWQKWLFKNSSFSPPPWSISEAWLDALFSSSRFLFILFVLRIM